MKGYIAKGDIAVPTADAADNTDVADVVGNKTDTKTGDSLVALTKAVGSDMDTLIESAEKIVEINTPANLPQATALALFTVTGVVQIIELRAFITQQVGAVANATKFTGGPGATNLCGTVELNAAAANSALSITGTITDALIINAGAFKSQANPITVGPGAISIDCAGSDGGTGGDGLLTYALVYKSVSSTGSVVAA